MRSFVTVSPDGDSFSFNFCKYNNSLNKFLLSSSNLDVVLDDFDFYFSFFVKKYIILENFWHNRCLSALTTPAGVVVNTPLYVAFAELALDKLRINPFHQLWEETLANWPCCPGTSLLDFCRTQYEIRREAAEASAEILRLKEVQRQEAFDAEVKFLEKNGVLPAYSREFARKIWSAGKDQKKARSALLVKVKKGKQLKREWEEACFRARVRAELAREFEPSPHQIQRAIEAQAFADKLGRKYATLTARVRAKRAAARALREKAIYLEVQDLLNAPLLPPMEKVEMIRKHRKVRPTGSNVVHTPKRNALEDLCPYQGLGAKSADVRCQATLMAGKIHATYPRLATAIYSWVLGPSMRFECVAPIKSFIKGLTFMVDFFPEEVLISELNKIETEAQCFEASLVVEEERAKLEAHAENANCRANVFMRAMAGVKNMARCAYSGFLSGCEEAGRSLSEGICSVMVDSFRKCVEMVSKELGTAIELIETMIRKVKKWFNDLLEKLHEGLATLGKYAMYALAILLGCGLTTLLENCIGGRGILTSLFVSGVFAAIGLQCAGGWDNLQREMVQMCTALAVAVFDCQNTGRRNAQGQPIVSPIMDIHNAHHLEDRRTRRMTDEQGNLRSIPVISGIINAMSQFGTGLCSMQSASLIEIGKIGAACHSMRMGKEALKEFCSTIMYYLGRVADKVTGRETVFFDELSSLVKVNVRSWILQAQSCVRESFHTEIGNAYFRDMVAKLVEEGQSIQMGVNGLPRKISADYGQLVGQIMKDLLELHKRTIRAGISEGRRPEPVWIYLFGQRHCGKSNFMSTLDNELSKYFGLPNTTAHRNGKDQFFSGYNGQTFLHIDDLSCVKLDPPLEAELINLVSCQDVPLNMADLADKPIYFRSPFIITSSNFEDLPAATGVRDVEAYRARKACLIEMRRKPGVVYDPDNALAASQARFKDPMSQMLMPGMDEETSWMEMSDVITEVLNISARHRAAQDKLQARFLREKAMSDPLALASEKFLQGDVKNCYLDFSGIELEKAGIPRPQGGRGLYVDGKVYLLDDLCQLEELEIAEEGYKRLWEERMRLKFLPRVQAKQILNTSSMVVTGFLRSLVNGDCAVLSVDSLSTGATVGQKSIFHGLRADERIYLRVLQHQLDLYSMEIPENPYSNSAWLKILRAIGAGRDFLVNHGCGILMVAAALCLILVAGFGFWKLFVGLFSGSMSLGSAIVGFSAVDIKAQHKSSSQEGGYRARNIPIHHRYAYAKSQAGDGLLPAARLCVAIYQPGGGFVSAMQYKNKSVRMTRHQALRFKEGEQLSVIFASTGESKLINWHKYHMREEPNSEIVTWLAPSLPALSPDLKDLFLEDKEVELPNHFKTIGYVLRVDSTAFHYDMLDTYAAVDKTPLPLKGVLGSELYLHEIPEKLTFHYESRNDDCGMILTAQIRGKMRVVGMLVAGKEKTSWADIMPPNSLAELKSQIEYIPEFGEACDGHFKVGYVGKADAPTLPKKTNMVPVPAHLRVPCEVPIKEPAVLTKEDPRCPAGVNPPIAALKKKFTQPMAELEQEILDEVATDILETWYDCEDHVLSDIPLEVAINGIPADSEEAELENFVMKTSPGYPYFKNNRAEKLKGKSAYFEEAEDGTLKLKEGGMAAELHENLVEFTKNEVPELVVIECTKDELLPERKIKVGACRLFEIMPLHYNLFLRQKTCAFTQFLQHNRHKLPCQVGTNPYSREWGHMLNRLMRVKTNEAINCDYSGFDGLLNAQVIECIAKMINRLYALSGESEVQQAQRYNMLMALVGRYAFVGQKVYKVNCGLPSGFALTVVVNSVFNEILIRYAYKKLAPTPERNRFNSTVCLLVYGDDNLISVSPSIASWFTGEAIRITLKEKNVKITDGSDKDAPTIEAKSFWELDFLKRKFLKLDNGIVQAPLDRSAIFSSLYWLTPDKSKFHESQKASDYQGEVDVVEELILNVNVALMELYLHNDPAEFQRVRGFYVKTLPLLVSQLRTWSFCEAFHSQQQTGMLKYDPAVILDHMSGADFKKFMHVSEQGNKAHFYTDILGVSGPHYKPQENDFVVSTLPLKMGVAGEHVPVQFGTGIGGLPTKKWVGDFGRPSRLKNAKGYLIYNLLREQVEAGKRLIFMGPAPYVANNAALISFGTAAKMLVQKDALVYYRNVIPEATSGLEQYFDAPLPTATVGTFYFANGETYAALCEFKDGKVLNYEGLPTQCLNQAVKERKLPCMAAGQVRNKFIVSLVCDNTMCPHHRSTRQSYEEAFRECWTSKCKTSACVVSKWYGTKLS
ncbi:polyprotein [Artichoke Italian latent virus]|uniref:RNA1 polyprotein n=1 Tax=Artichoke Italian latent virus TaxID=46075 RepID=A0A286UYD9_9SECO|nr:polyprotein [Artichoke Italian latent virus]SCN13017.1 polyprotein [Artichoke Italian latent virus]